MNSVSCLDSVLEKTENEGIKYVRFELGDMSGVSRCQVVPSRHFSERWSLGANMSICHLSADAAFNLVPSGSGFQADIGWANASFVPDLSTFCTVPWCENTALVLTEPRFQGTPVTSYPRYIARHQIDRLSEMGYSLLSAHEHEFYVIGAESKKPLHRGNFRSSLTTFADSRLLFEFEEGLSGVGVDVEAIQTEYSPGHVEITYKPAFGIRAPDNAHIYRTAIKEIAQKRGYIASFMTKPWPDLSGSSAHFCHSLWDVEGKVNIMHDPSMDLGISELAQRWIAGILAHATAISLLMAPTSNCLSRYKPYSFAPTNATWGIDNRTCALRFIKQGDNVYLENRMGASASNPYLTLAATVAAGIDGIKRSLPIPPRVTRDAYRKEEVPPGTRALPENLKAAVEAFQEDTVIREAVGEEFYREYLALKRFEIARDEESGGDNTAWEYDTFFEVV